MKQFSSESVTPGHPDKVADLISDSILDAYLAKDPTTRSAIETCIKDNLCFVFGEISSKAVVNIEEIVRKTVKEIGYDKEGLGFNADNMVLLVQISQQSPDIAQGVNQKGEKHELGAGDQGLMFGFANDDTPEFIPLPISLAHKLSKRLVEVREKQIIKGLRPDGKTQVTVDYDDNNNPVAVSAIVLSTQHNPEVKLEDLRKQVKEHIIDVVIPKKLITKDTKYFINPTGRFVTGGPVGDAGLTGRKIIADTYGGFARHGGGAFSGKDATKVDRSAAYMARYLAKQIVASKIAKAAEIQIAYAIGVAQPVSLYVNTFGTSKVSDDKILKTIWDNFDLTPKGIIKFLDLNKPNFAKTTNFGHFGKEGVSWEKLDHVQLFSKLAQ